MASLSYWLRRESRQKAELRAMTKSLEALAVAPKDDVPLALEVARKELDGWKQELHRLADQLPSEQVRALKPAKVMSKHWRENLPALTGYGSAIGA